jgi:RHS repeat-associated protein
MKKPLVRFLALDAHGIQMSILPQIKVMATALTCDVIAKGLSYDPASQVTQVLHQLQATSVQVNKAAYAYNPVGNRTSLTDRRGAQAFGYDTLDRLTSASHPLLATSQAFAYDAVGNRTTGGTVVNAGNQLTADANYGYQYDDNGNLTRKTLLATGNYSQYTYDAENRLTKVEEFVAGNPTPAFTSTYRYDGLGRRIEKVANGQTKRYVYDGEDILLEYNGSNVLQARYTHGPGIDEPIAVTKGSNTFFYHQDGLGTVTDLTDSTGATTKSYSYDAYGTIVDQTGTVDQPYSYTGREFDSETGLYYYRARYYDATTGRFLQKDPIGFRGGINVYSYVGANPAALIDPYGLAGLWREESSPGEPGPHQSLGFGDPNGKNGNYSFGVKEGESPFGGGGAVYRDRNSGGKIFDYYDVPPEYELAIWTELFFKEKQEGKLRWPA